MTYAENEIERRWLLKGLPEECLAFTPRPYTVGYLPWGTPEIVERITKRFDSAGNVKDYSRTIKKGTGLVRLEMGHKISKETFDLFWPLTENRRSKKQKFFISENDSLVWEVTQFLDRDLFLAETELTSVDTLVNIPKWLKPYIYEEVTENPAYEAYSLVG